MPARGYWKRLLIIIKKAEGIRINKFKEFNQDTLFLGDRVAKYIFLIKVGLLFTISHGLINQMII